VVAARAYGVEVATQGAIHESAGFFVYVVGCMVLIAVGRLMRLVKPLEPAAT